MAGGHSMCTLDYPFAHVLLDNKDFKKYVDKSDRTVGDNAIGVLGEGKL